MKTRHLLPGLLLMLLGTLALRAETPGFGEVPIEITNGPEGSTRVSPLGVVIAENEVAIHYHTASIFADYAEYDRQTHDVLLIGNVRIYREGHLFTGDRVLYNLETHVLRAANFRGDTFPVFFQARAISSLEGNAFEGNDCLITTDDSSKTDYSFRAGTVRVYPGDHVVLSNATVYLGETPVLWFPYFYQSLKRDQGFNFIPGYNSPWGAYVLLRDAFPISDGIHGIAHFDVRERRGAAGGVDALGNYGPTYDSGDTSWVRFKSYEAYDTDTSINPTAQTQSPIDSERYRISLQDRTFFTDDIYASADINKLSDYLLLRDFYPAEYNNNPQPDNVVSLTDRNENFTLTAIARAHLNDFFATTERLPEFVLDVKRQPIFDWPVFYEGETSFVRLARDYGSALNPENLTATENSPFTDYRTNRYDSFHQLSMPETLFGWLNLVPVIGARATYYDNRANTTETTLNEVANNQFPTYLNLNQNATALIQKDASSSIFRPVFNAGLESTFKISQEWEKVQSRDWGLDGLRHIIQPYGDLSYVRTPTDPLNVLQFDTLNPATQLPPLDFPQYNSIDAIPNWTIYRLGMRNTLQTRRDDRTIDWLTMDTYFNYNIDAPKYPGLLTENQFSNVFNNIAWSPVPWGSLFVNSQVPLFDSGYTGVSGTNHSGFTEINPGVNFMVSRDCRITVSHVYINNNPYFTNESNLRFGIYYRLDDNWAVDLNEQYEFSNFPGLEFQQYEIQRSLSSWVASLGLVISRNVSSTQTVIDTGVVLTFTLKDLPSVTTSPSTAVP